MSCGQREQCPIIAPPNRPDPLVHITSGDIMKPLKLRLVFLSMSLLLSGAAAQAQSTLADLVGEPWVKTPPKQATLKLDVQGHGRGDAQLNMKTFNAEQTTGSFNSGAFIDNPVQFTAKVMDKKLMITTSAGHKLEAVLEKKTDGMFTGSFTGDFSGTVTLNLK
jgi:hypothetical protein